MSRLAYIMKSPCHQSVNICENSPVISKLGCGGAERCLLDIIGHSKSANIETRLCVLGSQARFPDPSLLPENLVFLDHPGGFKNLKQLIVLVRRVRREIRDYEPDIIHSHLWPADIAVGFSNIGLGVTLISHQQGTSPGIMEANLKGWVKHRQKAKRQ